MELALYGVEGFYTKADGGSAGRRGDFITSPEVGPLFGAVIARYLDAEWKRIGQPEVFTVVDAGAGPGTLARSVRAARPECSDALHYVAVEISPGQRERHPDGVESEPSMPAEPFDGVVIANELLDNLPFRLAVFDQGWREAFVQAERDGRFVEVLSTPIDPVPAFLPTVAQFGARAPLVDRAAAFVDRARSLVRSGSVVDDRLRHPDHGDARRSPVPRLAADLPKQRARRALPHRTRNAGHHHRCTDRSAPRTRHRARPGSVPSLWGIEELVDEGKRIWHEQASRPGLEAMKMRSRISESEALLDPDGLGGFLVAEWRSSQG